MISVGSLGLPVKYEGRVQLCYEAAEKLIPGADIFLYGNYAENRGLADSSVKLLILVGDSCSQREIKTLGWEVEDLISRISNEAFPFEITVLTLSLYQLGCRQSKELSEVARNKKNLRLIRWIDK